MVVGGFLAVATANPSIEVIDLTCMKPHGTLEGHIMAVSALASLEGDTRLVSGSHDTFIRRVHLHIVACNFFIVTENMKQTRRGS